MLRRAPLSVLRCTKGRPYKNYGGYKVIHASQRPAAEANIEFGSLGLTYPITHTPSFSIEKDGWSAPPKSPPSHLPFTVDRTLVGQSIPVYTEYKGGRTKVLTILRRCGGDIGVLKDEMEKVVGTEVEIRPGKLVVTGNYNMRLKKWLAGLGF